MRDQTPGAVHIRSARLGGTTIGAATVIIDDEALVVIGAAAEEHAARVRLASVQRITVRGDEVAVALAHDTSLALLTDTPAELHALLLGACRALPEFTRGLRGFGSQRRVRAARPSRADEQQRFFGALLEARRAAQDAPTAAAVLTAFDARRIRRSLDAALHVFAQTRAPGNAPARRALEAELVDATAPFAEALDELDGLARMAQAALDDVTLWRAWSARLVATFEAADRAWMAVDSALESPSVFHDVVQPATRGHRP